MIPVLAVQLGRLGDILNILPACRHLNIRHMMIHPAFDVAMRGQSYVEPVYFSGDIEDLRFAVEYARVIAKDVRVAQLFGRVQPDGLSPRSRPSFVMDQWDRLRPGLGDLWGKLPLEFDRRDAPREAELIVQLRAHCGRPTLLVNTFSHSSPLDPHYAAELYAHLESNHPEFHVIRLGDVRAFSYCDLLGLYERAAGLITVDSASLHLCRACPNLPTFRFVRPDHDATPIREFEHTQAYHERGMGKIDEFVAALKGRN